MVVLSIDTLAEKLTPRVVFVDGVILRVRPPQTYTPKELALMRVELPSWQQYAKEYSLARTPTKELLARLDSHSDALLDLLLDDRPYKNLKAHLRYIELAFTALSSFADGDDDEIEEPDYGLITANLKKYYNCGDWWNTPLWEIAAASEAIRKQEEPDAPPVDSALLALHSMGVKGVFDGPG